MSNELPFVSCLCPTYRRPQMMGTTTLAFHGQDYPADRRELIILDDAGELQNDSCDGWQIISIPRQFRSLPEKFNAIAGRRKATSSSSGRTTTSTCHTTSARTCQRWKGGSGQSHRLCSAVTPDVWSRKTPPVASTPHRTVVIPAAAFSLRLGVRMCLSRKDAKVIRHRTARTVPLLCEHTAWGLDERGMAPAPARQHRRYTSILVFFAPLRLGVRMCLARKDAKTQR